jgi:hypothetical protein
MKRARSVRYIEDHGQWHLDRRVPIALIFAIIVQAAVIVQWGSGITSDVSTLKTEVSKIQLEAQAQAGKLDKLSILETEIKHISNSLLRLEASLDRLAFRTDSPTTPPLPQRR